MTAGALSPGLANSSAASPPTRPAQANNMSSFTLSGMTSPGLAGMPAGMFGGPVKPSTPASLQPSIGGAASSANKAKPASSNAAGGGGGFDDLWSSALGSGMSSGGAKTSGKSVAELERERSQATLWGASSSSTTNSQAKPQSSGGFDDLLF